jgi:inosose dehydratase
VTATLHPHVGTVVESQEEVWRVIEGSNVPLCLDTGHLLIGGTDPADLARQVSDRIAHTHLKDVDASWARRVRSREVAYTDAVRQGMYRRLGAGDVDIAGIVAVLESSGYQGWYVMEQDTILTSAPDDEGPVVEVRAGVEFLRGLG